MKAKIITNIKKYLIEENIYSAKDEITLFLLENTYTQYIKAVKNVKKEGQTIVITDSNKNTRTVINPNFKSLMDLQKELFKIIDSLYLSPKSRRTKKDYVDDKENPFTDMLKSLNNIEKR